VALLNELIVAIFTSGDVLLASRRRRRAADVTRNRKREGGDARTKNRVRFEREKKNINSAITQ